jgi:hypothetical protein
MKRRILLLGLTALVQTVGRAEEVIPTSPYEGSEFIEVWQKVSHTPYTPGNRPTRSLSDLVNGLVERSLSQTGKALSSRKTRNKELVKRANQTLNDRTDYYENDFTKLVHANGICLKGSWNMTEPNPYTGYFEQGKTGLMIARASVAMFGTKKKQNRGFGLAGKIYPASDKISTVGRKLKPANFFTVNDLGGKKDVLFTEVSLTNQPPTTFNLTLLRFLCYVLKVANVFKTADAQNGNAAPDPGVRQLYEISELGLSDEEPVEAITPRCIRIKARPGQRNDRSDFRDELDLAGYENSKLILDVYADSPRQETACGDLSEAMWAGNKIGYIEFSESVASDNCDKRLHFPHPKWKNPRHQP